MLKAGTLVLFAALAAAPSIPSYRPPPSSGNAKTQSQPQAQDHRNDTSRHERGTEQSPLIVQISQPKEHEAIATKAEESGEWYARPDWWVAGGTIALFIATAGLWLVTWMLWQSTSKLVRDEHENSIRELRAYVMTDNFTIQVWNRYGRILVLVRIINSGKTPAHRIMQKWGFRLGDEALSEPFTEKESLPGKVPLGPGQPHTATLWYPLDKVPTGKEPKKTRLYLIGLIKYEDVFGHHQTTTFRGFLVKGPDGQYFTRFADDGNDAT